MLSLPTPPHEATKLLLMRLPSRRMRYVLEKRYGLKGGKKKTLDAIGKEYKITRERVRQIESEALKHVAKPENLKELDPMFRAMDGYLKHHGEVMAEDHLMTTLAEARQKPHIALLLDVGPLFVRLPETNHCHHRWTVNKTAADTAEKIMAGVVRDLEEKNTTASEEALHAMVSKNAKALTGETLSLDALHAYCNISKLIRKNPYGEYGLISWSAVSPSGVKDKAYVAFSKSGKPMHFREVAEAINKAGWPAHRSPARPAGGFGASGSKKRAHPQTVHNELIKDNRFVLVGRGMYALREWGYEPGAVRDVVASVMKHAGHSLSKEEIVTLVLEKRMVKVPTIFLNLQNRSYFKKTDEGKYILA